MGLAPILVSRVIGKIKELKERRQLTVLMAEQNFNQATKIADRGYIIVHGKIEFEGRSTQELRENELVKKYYLGADPRLVTIRLAAACLYGMGGDHQLHQPRGGDSAVDGGAGLVPSRPACSPLRSSSPSLSRAFPPAW